MKDLARFALVLGFLMAGIPLDAQDQDTYYGLPPEVLKAVPAVPQGNNPPRVTRCKGTYLHTDIIDTKVQYQFQAEIRISKKDGQPTFLLAKQEMKVLTEVKIYEVLQRVFTPGEDEDHGTYDYQRLEGETWEGEKSQRTIPGKILPLANEKVLIDGIEFFTDQEGFVLDPDHKLDILGHFDDLGNRKQTFVIQAKGMEPFSFAMTRTMPQRRANDERRIEEDDSHDILIAYGLDFRLSKAEPEQNSLQCKAILPKDFPYAKTGQYFPLAIQVSNPSARQTSCLIARTFSRIPGLDGKLFYFGAILPGETRTFVRLVHVDKAVKTSNATVEIRFSDSWSIPKQRLTLQFPVIH